MVKVLVTKIMPTKNSISDKTILPKNEKEIKIFPDQKKKRKRKADSVLC